MRRFEKILPVTLYRIQHSLPVGLRDFEIQMAKNRKSFDLKLHDSMYLPIPNQKDFIVPNGMSLRPKGENMRNILENFRGNPVIYRMDAGISLPDNICVYHEHSDHYSMQTTVPITLPDYNMKLTEFLKTLPTQTRDEFIEEYDDFDDQDN